MIHATGLVKKYGDFVAVDHIDLHVEPGLVYGFLGPNGAGKTTTIKMLVGMMQPTEGSVLIDGLDLAKDRDRAKARMGFIPDRPYIYERLTGMEFMHFIGGLFRMDGADIKKHGHDLLALFEIAHVENELVSGYSHGMRQRLIMASALLHRPRLLVVDEPMVGLDPRGAKLVKKIFREQARLGTTIFMSTHTLQVAEEICDRISIINTGKIIATGTVAELKASAGALERFEETFLQLTGAGDEQDVSVIFES
ncbi:MAG: ABC transporter ATP-binding protein [Deltaproteobacteria bacterium]|nr:ABC transporter ATP-binding protein [Deltaproteobacteria bacterium]